MKSKSRLAISVIFLIMVMCLSLTNTTSVLADESTPTEPPIPTETEVPTEPPVVATDLPVEATPTAEEILPVSPTEETPVEETSVAEILADVPENTDVVVLDENGNSISLATQDAADMIVSGDPQWCPVGVLPGDPSCSTAYGSIALLLANMQSNTSFYDHDGVIYFLSGASGNSFSLTTGSLGSGDFSTLRTNNLTLQGGWNGLNGAGATFTGTTDFGTNTITIGDSHSSNRDWDGNLTLSNFSFTGASSSAINIFVEDGNVNLNNITVTDQTGGSYATYVDVDSSGNITIQNSIFDGNAAGTSQGVFANTDNGSLNVSNTTFQQSYNSSTSTNYNGATLGADAITLTNVTATQNDGNGIFMDNPDIVFLDHVVATNNGTDPPGNGINDAVGSGVNIDGGGGSSTLIFVNGGTFSNNKRYGVQVSNSDIYVQSAPSCSGNNFAAGGTGNCYSEAAVTDTTAPNTNITGGPSGLTNNPNPSFTFNGTDNITPANYLTFECKMDGGAFTSCSSPQGYSSLAQGNHTFQVRAKDLMGNVDASPAQRSFTVDSIPPVVTITFPAPNGPNGWFISAPVNGSVTATDNINIATLTCSGSGVSTGSLVGGGTPNASRPVSVSGSGSHAVTCTASDGAGTGSDSETVQIDLANPTVNITGGPNGLTNNPNPNFTFNGSDDSGVPVTFECSLDGGAFASCSSPKGYSGLADGAHTFQVRAIDVVGRVSSPASRNFTVDAHPPTITINFPAPNGANGWFITSPVSGSVSASDNINVASLSCSGSGVSQGSATGINTPNASRTLSVSGSGSHNVNCTASDGASNVSDSITIRIDSTPPTMLYFGSSPNDNSFGWNNSPVTLGWICLDFGSGAVDFSVDETISTEGTNQSATGTCQDNAGNTNTDTRGGFNIDMTKPVITGSRSPAPNANGWNNTNVAVSFTCTDALSGINTNTVAGATVSAQGAGQSVTNTGTCTDRAGNVASPVTVSGINIDKTAPVLNLPVVPPAEATSGAGAAVSFTVTASDNLDPLPNIVCVPPSGSTFPIGTSAVTCTGTDRAGNASTGSFNITVQDTTAPVIAPHVDVTEEATSALGAIVNYTSPATSDIVDGAGTATCAPASGSQFALGNTTVTCNATDAHGNAAAPTNFVVHVVDTTAPVIAPHADETVEATSPLGAILSYASPSTSDTVDGAGTATCLPASGSQFAVGNTTVTCNATDTQGNAATPTTFVVHVVDTTAPVIEPHADLFFEINGEKGTIAYDLPVTTDIVDGVGVATCSPASGTLVSIGEYTITCTATDAHGNTAIPITFVIQLAKKHTNAQGIGGSVVIPVTGGGLVDLTCVSPSSFRIQTVGARFIFNNLCGYQASVEGVEKASLPGKAPNGNTFAGSFNVNILKNGKVVKPLPAGSSINIQFEIPSGQQNKNFAVYAWNGKEWAEIGGQNTADGFYVVTVTEGGTFMLVTK